MVANPTVYLVLGAQAALYHLRPTCVGFPVRVRRNAIDEIVTTDLLTALAHHRRPCPRCAR